MRIERYWNLCFFRLLEGVKVIIKSTVDLIIWKLISFFMTSEEYKKKRDFFTKEIESNHSFLFPYVYGQMILSTMLILFSVIFLIFSKLNINISSKIFTVCLSLMIPISIFINYFLIKNKEKYIRFSKDFNVYKNEKCMNILIVLVMIFLPLIFITISAQYLR